MRTRLFPFFLIAASSLTACQTQSLTPAAAPETASAMALDSIALLTLEHAKGTWDWYKGDSTCLGNIHEVSFSRDYQTMTLTFREPIDTATGQTVVNYRVLAVGSSVHASHPYSIRTSMEDETRRTDAGELVVWDFMLATANRYHWHRTDWPNLGITGAVVRCEGGKPLEQWSAPTP